MNGDDRLPSHCRAADAAEAAAFADMYAAAPGELAAMLGLRTESLAGATLLFAPALPAPVFNRVIGFGTFEPATEAALDAIVERYRAAGIGSFWLPVSPAARPDSLVPWLQARGFTLPKRRAWAQMRWSGGLPSAVSTSLQIDAARVEDAADLARVITAAFEMPARISGWMAALVGRPGWQGFAARKGTRVVGGGLVFTQSPLAWIGMGSVLPEARGEHGQLALFAARIAHAQARGCTSIHTETGEPVDGEPSPSLANMLRCGFEKVASRVNYAK